MHDCFERKNETIRCISCAAPIGPEVKQLATNAYMEAYRALVVAQTDLEALVGARPGRRLLQRLISKIGLETGLHRTLSLGVAERQRAVKKAIACLTAAYRMHACYTLSFSEDRKTIAVTDPVSRANLAAREVQVMNLIADAIF